MKNFKRWSLISLASLLIVSCAGGVSNQATANSASDAASPSSTAIAQMNGANPTTLKSGKFVSGEHPTQGTARVIRINGKSFLDLDQSFKTFDMGPDLVVILHRSSDVLGSTKPPAYPLKSGDYVLLAPLRKFSGAQRYAIPTNVNLANYKSAAIWCRRFNATFGAAKLN